MSAMASKYSKIKAHEVIHDLFLKTKSIDFALILAESRVWAVGASIRQSLTPHQKLVRSYFPVFPLLCSVSSRVRAPQVVPVKETAVDFDPDWDPLLFIWRLVCGDPGVVSQEGLSQVCVIPFPASAQ